MENEITGEMIEEVRESLLEYLPKLEQGLISILSKYDNKEYIEAQNLWADALEGFKWVLDVLNTLYPDKVDMGSLNETFETLLDAMESNDRNTVSDVIEYELIDLVREWTENL